MVTDLMVVLGASLVLFVLSLAYAVVAAWLHDRRAEHMMVAEHTGLTQYHPRDSFVAAARPPVRFLGSFIL